MKNSICESARWIIFILHSGQKYLGYIESVCNPCGDCSYSDDVYDIFHSVAPQVISFKEGEIAEWHFVKHGMFYWETYDGKHVDITSNAQRTADLQNIFECDVEKLDYEVRKSKAEDMRNWVLLNSECMSDIILTQISDSVFFLETSEEIKLNAQNAVIPDNLIIDPIRKLSVLKKTIPSLEKELTTIADSEKKHAMNRRISRLQHMIKPIKDCIEYTDCIDREFSSSCSNKD